MTLLLGKLDCAGVRYRLRRNAAKEAIDCWYITSPSSVPELIFASRLSHFKIGHPNRAVDVAEAVAAAREFALKHRREGDPLKREEPPQVSKGCAVC